MLLLLLFGVLAGCRPAGSRLPTSTAGVSTNASNFLEVAKQGRVRSEMDLAVQHPVAYVRGWLDGRPRYSSGNRALLPLPEALKFYGMYSDERVLLSEDLQELNVGSYDLSAHTRRGLATAFEKMMLTNGVAFLRTEPNTVFVVATSNAVIKPANAPSALRGAAESDDPKAQAALAQWYYEHRPSRPANRMEAFKWATVAATRQNRDAKYLIRKLELSLSPKEQADGNAAAKAFLESHAETKPGMGNGT